jgi:hypothetical protein
MDNDHHLLQRALILASSAIPLRPARESDTGHKALGNSPCGEPATMSIPYETQLRECLRDFAAMVENELQAVQTGKSNGPRMRDCIGQWRSLCRDARNILNRENNSYDH